MAAAFVAMNEVFGPVFKVDPAEAKEPDAAAARASSLSRQFIFDDQTHFVRDDYSFEGLMGLAQYAAANWNPDMKKEPVGMGLERYKFAELPEGDLLRQRHENRSAERRAVR